MPDKMFFALINDNAVATSQEYEECVAFCRDGAGDPVIVRTKSDALHLRDLLRERENNPDINVYRMTIHEDPVERAENTEG